MRYPLSMQQQCVLLIIFITLLVMAPFAPLRARAQNAAPGATLSLSAAGGQAAVMPVGNRYATGTVVTLNAIPDPGMLFLAWVVDGTERSWNAQFTLTMERDYVVIARFAPRPGFADLPDGPAADAITQLAARGIVRGYGDGRFGPRDLVMRAQTAAFLCRMLGWETEEHDTPFADRESVDADLWRNVGTLAARGIARGYADGTYHPTEAVIQAQTISFIARAMVARGYWQAQADDPARYPELPGDSGHRDDLATYIHYAGAPVETTANGWPDWQTQATRQWFAEALWQALSSHVGVAALPTASTSPAPPALPASSPLPTMTPQPTPTATVQAMSPTPRSSPSASPLASATPIPSASATPTPGPSATPLPSATPRPTATPSPTPSPSLSPSATPGASPSPSPTLPLPTATPTSMPSSSPVASPSGFVGRSGTQFILDGQPFRFVGFNLFDAAATASYKCAWWERYSDAELDQAMAVMKEQAGASVLRIWAFQPYTASGTDWSGLDRVITLARKHDMKIIPVLENGPEHCSNYGSAKWQNGDIFYGNAYRRDYTYGYPLSLPDYIDRIVGRYKGEPAIMAWMIMNEADTGDKDGLYTFAAVLSAQIKALDPNHLVTLGTQSNGVSGSSGVDFIRLYGLPTIDFAEGHDYSFWAPETEALPGSIDGHSLPDPRSPACLTTDYIPNNAKIGCSIAQSLQILGKPFLAGEAGVKGGADQVARQRRADLLDAKMSAFFANGGSGYLIWQWNRILDVEQYDVLSDTADPLLPKMKRHANSFVTQSTMPLPVAPAAQQELPALPASLEERRGRTRSSRRGRSV